MKAEIIKNYSAAIGTKVPWKATAPHVELKITMQSFFDIR